MMHIILCIVIIVLLILLISVMILIIQCNKNKKNKILFVHIPKTGGTTICQLGSNHGYNWGYQGEGDSGCSCVRHHRPPTKEILSYGLPVFTVVRNPYHKIVSEYKYRKSTKDLNIFISEHMDKLANNKYDFQCHWVPQHKFTKYCNHILKHESLKEDFEKLMLEYFPLEEIKLDILLNKSKDRGVSIKDISPENIRRINQYYRKDFEKFGYQMIEPI